MARQYSPKTFLRQVRRRLIDQFLRQRQIPFETGFDAGKPADIDRLYERLLQLPADALKRVELDLATIGEMATPAGTLALLREAQIYGVTAVAEVFAQARNHHERSLWAFLHHPKLFEQASMCCRMDHFGAGRWRRRFVGSGLEVSLDEGPLSELKKMIQQLYQREGRGNRCHIDPYVREQPRRYCLFAFPEDHASSDLGFGDDGRLREVSRKLAFEVIFVYRSDDGVLEVLAPGGREYVEDLTNAFCWTVLGLQELPPNRDAPGFNLELLMDRTFTFRTLPEEAIEAVYICELTLKLPGHNGKQLVVRARPNARDTRAVHNIIDEYLNKRQLFTEDIEIVAARLRFQFAPEGGRRRGRSLPVRLTLPDGTNLKDGPHDQLAKRVLQRSGIILDAAAAEALVRGGPARGRLLLAG